MSHFIAINDVGYAVIYKNASTELLSQKHKEISKAEFLVMKTRKARLRDPIERFYSAFKFFYGLLHSTTSYEGFNLNKASSFEKFTDFALDNVDPHWQQQSDFITDNNTLIINEYEMLKPIENAINASKHIEFNKSYRLNDIRAYYSSDYKLMETLQWL